MNIPRGRVWAPIALVVTLVSLAIPAAAAAAPGAHKTSTHLSVRTPRSISPIMQAWNLSWHYHPHQSTKYVRPAATTLRRYPLSILPSAANPRRPFRKASRCRRKSSFIKPVRQRWRKTPWMERPSGSRSLIFGKTSFGQRFGFASRPELLAASTPLTAADGTSWWTTAIADNRWIVWNQDDMSAAKTYATLQEARNSIYPAIS